MSGATTLDQRIRKAAIDAVRAELQARADALYNFKAPNYGRAFGWTKLPFQDNDVVIGPTNPILGFGDLLNRAVTAYIKEAAVSIGDKAVRKFMEKVNSLSVEVGEIRNMVEDLPRGT